MFLVWDWSPSRPEQVNCWVVHTDLYFLLSSSVATDLTDSACFDDELSTQRRLQNQTRRLSESSVVFIQYAF